MKLLIKVCGVQSVDEASGCIKAGANMIGLLLGLTHIAEDEVTAETAKEIVISVPDNIRTVMVTHLLDFKKIAKIAKFVGVSSIQIHDELPVQDIIKLRELCPKLELIKAIHVTGMDALEKASEYAPHVDMLLLDSRTKERLGGTGQTHDWDISRQIVSAINIPVILAGGLTHENVRKAIDKVQPAGIDANSGLEHSDGSKDFTKIAAFAKAG